MNNSIILHAVLVSSVWAFAGCSFLIEPSTYQCEATEDCTVLPNGAETECKDFVCVPEPVVDPLFGCKDTPWPELDTTKSVEITFDVITLSSSDPVVGLAMSQCNSLFDRECQNPVQTVTTDSEGIWRGEVPSGFRGHFFAPEQSAFAAQIYHMFPPPNPDDPSTLNSGMFLANFSEISAAASVVGVSLLPDTGVYFFTARDCSGDILQGVKVTATSDIEETITAYIATSGLPDSSLEATGPNGTGAIINVPEGNIRIVAEHESFGKIFDQTVIIAKNTITAGTVVPSP